LSRGTFNILLSDVVVVKKKWLSTEEVVINRLGWRAGRLKRRISLPPEGPGCVSADRDKIGVAVIGPTADGRHGNETDQDEAQE
jgi:hypothetical protein